MRGFAERHNTSNTVETGLNTRRWDQCPLAAAFCYEWVVAGPCAYVCLRLFSQLGLIVTILFYVIFENMVNCQAYLRRGRQACVRPYLHVCQCRYLTRTFFLPLRTGLLASCVKAPLLCAQYLDYCLLQVVNKSFVLFSCERITVWPFQHTDWSTLYKSIIWSKTLCYFWQKKTFQTCSTREKRKREQNATTDIIENSINNKTSCVPLICSSLMGWVW